ncbi:MAG: PDZ domain-containing protein [Rhodopirellula sp. JB044]|uniref:PDZ domain-containing protein n=1 Tax=Rhodopirellula sp. JB044 TaxID=3342844 RepID=UPI00370A6EA1
MICQPLTRMIALHAVAGMFAASTAVHAVEVGVPSEIVHEIDSGIAQPEIGDERKGNGANEPGGFVEPKEPPPGRGPGHAHFGNWYLGVYGHYTDTGHLLTQVYTNTAAARAGLEPGDRIVCINGYQIGDVLGRRYPLDRLLQRHASHHGWVRLLVQDRRSMQLINMDVQLTRGQIHF